MAAADAAEIPEDLYPIAVLIDELKHDDVQCRLNSMRKLALIATALGPERTRDELIPFLEEGCDDDDEVLLVMAEQLGQFVPYVGGPEHAHALLSPLQHLAVVEETTVRDRAVAALNAVLASMPQEAAERHGWPLVKRLGERDWFTSKTSACGLLPRCYARLPPRAVARTRPWAAEAASAAGGKGSEAGAAGGGAAGGAGMEVDGASPRAEPPGGREDALELYMRLCSGEEVPMVRRAGAAHLPALGTALAGGDIPLPPLTAEAAAEAAARASASVGASVQVDTGDVSASSAPPAVPLPVIVSAASPAAGGAAVQQLLPSLQAFSRDDQDGVRLLAVDGCVALARLCNGGMASVTTAGPEAAALLSGNRDLRAAVLGVFTALAADRSWRVRWSVANRYAEAALAFGTPIVNETLLAVFDRLAADPEGEVRTAAAYRVADLGQLVPREKLLSVVLPAVQRLSEDGQDPVRSALAAVILGLAPPLGTEATIASLLPLFLKLLKDSSPQVRLNIISRLEAVNSVIGLRMLAAALLPAITDLSNDKSWRVRAATIEFFPSLARQLGQDVFEASPEMLDLITRWMADSVASIREGAALNLKRLAEVFGPEWADRVLVPRVLAFGRSGLPAEGSGERNYQARITGLVATLLLSEAMPPATVRTRLLPLILSGCGDPVPNLRFGAAKGLAALARAGRIDAMALPAVRAALAGLGADPDDDVRYYAGKALAALPAA